MLVCALAPTPPLPRCSPGPVTSNPASSLGRQVLSTKSSTGCPGFGSSKRLEDHASDVPGPGEQWHEVDWDLLCMEGNAGLEMQHVRLTPALPCLASLPPRSILRLMACQRTAAQSVGRACSATAAFVNSKSRVHLTGAVQWTPSVHCMAVWQRADSCAGQT